MGLSASKSGWVPFVSGIFAVTDVISGMLIYSSQTCWGSYIYCLDAAMHVLGAIGYSTKSDWMMHTQQYFGIVVMLVTAAFHANHLSQFASTLTMMGYGQHFNIHHPYYGQFVLSGIVVLVVGSAMTKLAMHLKIGAYLHSLVRPSESFAMVDLETATDESKQNADDVKSLLEAAEKRMEARLESWTERMTGYFDVHTKQMEAKFAAKSVVNGGSA